MMFIIKITGIGMMNEWKLWVALNRIIAKGYNRAIIPSVSLRKACMKVR